MPQMLRLSQGYWLNLEQIVEVKEYPGNLRVTCVVTEGNEHGERWPYVISLAGEERERLLAWLAQQPAYVRPPMADNDDENTPPF